MIKRSFSVLLLLPAASQAHAEVESCCFQAAHSDALNEYFLHIIRLPLLNYKATTQRPPQLSYSGCANSHGEGIYCECHLLNILSSHYPFKMNHLTPVGMGAVGRIWEFGKLLQQQTLIRVYRNQRMNPSSSVVNIMS